MSASKPSKQHRLVEARARLAKARKQWDMACTDSWEPPEPAECVTKCFYSYENALTAAATALGTTWTTKHHEKVKLAKELYKKNRLKTDVSERLNHLNELRKNIQYDELSSEDDVDLEDLTSDLESFLDEVQALIDALDNEP